MMIKISEKEAINTIREWGTDIDNFVAHNSSQMLIGGEPTDNSIEIAQYFTECLKIVADIGIKEYEQNHA